jgi:mono/diheme cytochrome c family protein
MHACRFRLDGCFSMRILFALLLLTSGAFAANVQQQAMTVLSKHCVRCHGAEKQRGGLRLDQASTATTNGNSGKAIVQYESAKSLLIELVQHTDAEQRMPPGGTALGKDDIATLKAWIDSGAKFNKADDAKPGDWWSFQPLAKIDRKESVHPVDQWIDKQLAERKLKPTAKADRRTLIRRLTYDLTGLPPTAAEVEAFVKSYEKLVERLLGSTRYGEHWARHWLDVVHYGETHGYDKDQPRTNAWPYRDYVIRSLNDDKPYRKFVQEQLAGDVLFPGTVDGIEALGFLAAGPWDFIGHVEVPESKIDGKVARHLDRDDFVANTMGTFTGLTVHCAQCHNHKFDPISQEDYYRLQTVFAAIDRADKAYDADPVYARRKEQVTLLKAAFQKLDQEREDKARAMKDEEFIEIDKQFDGIQAIKKKPKPDEYGYHSAIATKQDSEKWVQIDLGEERDITVVVLKPCQDDFNNIGAGFGFPIRFKIEASSDAEFKKSIVLLDETQRDVVNPRWHSYRSKFGSETARYVRLTATRLAPRQNDFILALAELEVQDTEGKNLAADKTVTAKDSIEAPKRWGKSNLTDGLFPPSTSYFDEDIKLLNLSKLVAISRLVESDLVTRELLKLELAKAEKTLAAHPVPPKRTAYIGTVHKGSGNFTGTGANGGTPRPIHLLHRGDVTKPGKLIEPGPLRSIPGTRPEFDLPKTHAEGDRRAALAKWITDDNNPLTWRVMANRVWQYHFGRGLVDTPNDFGKMGQLPTHPELLDLLAGELRSHQSLKKLHQLIVTSEAYQRSSTDDPANSKVDGENTSYWRGNRRKLTAEQVRDSMLLAAGKLNEDRTGGPSFQDFVIEKPEHSPHYQYQLHDAEDTKTHRRSIYRFVVRSRQQPFLAALDCADPSVAVDKRNTTLTPQQALATLNNQLALVMAMHLATRIEKTTGTPEAKLEFATQTVFQRPPTAKERELMIPYAAKHGWANTARVLLNLNEFVFVD